RPWLPWLRAEAVPHGRHLADDPRGDYERVRVRKRIPETGDWRLGKPETRDRKPETFETGDQRPETGDRKLRNRRPDRDFGSRKRSNRSWVRGGTRHGVPCDIETWILGSGMNRASMGAATTQRGYERKRLHRE